MENTDVIVVGELNVDIILNNIASFPEPGKEMMAKEMTVTLGSSSAIFASNLSSLGASVAFIGKIGMDYFGQLVIQSLQAKGVHTGLVIQSEKMTTGATIVLNHQEERAMVTHAGAMEHFSLADIPFNRLAKARHLHFSSYFLQPQLQKDIGKLFRKAKEMGLTTSFDPQWDPQEKWDIDLKNILPVVDVFLPNEKELLLLTGTETIPAAIEAIKDIANTVVVKLGNQGSVSYHNNTRVHKQPYLNEKVVDAIGAGDSFNAGFIYKFLEQAPIAQCQVFGNLTGAISTTSPGGTTAFTTFAAIMKIAKERFGYAG